MKGGNEHEKSNQISDRVRRVRRVDLHPYGFDFQPLRMENRRTDAVVIFYSPDPIRDAADYYDWLEANGKTLEELEQEEGEEKDG